MTTAGRQPLSPQVCSRFAWCAQQEKGHSEHLSVGVPVPDAEDMVLYVETDPDTGAVMYGPVLGGDGEDRPLGEARVVAAQFRVVAARLDELVAWAEAC